MSNVLNDNLINNSFETLDAIRELCDGDHDKINDLVESLIRLKSYNEAKLILTGLMETMPTSGRAYFNLGVISLAENDKKSAHYYFYKAFNIGYITPTSLMNIGMLELSLNNKDKAFEFLDKIGASEIKDVTMGVILFSLYCDNFDYEKCENIADAMIEKWPKLYSGYHAKLKVLLKQQKTQEAQLYVEEIESSFGDVDSYVLDSAKVLYENGLYTEAVSLLEKKEFEDNKVLQDVISLKVRCYIKLGESCKIQNDLRQLSDLFMDLKSKLGLAMISMTEKEYEKAKSMLDEIIRVSADDPYYYFALFLNVLCAKLLELPEYDSMIEDVLKIYDVSVKKSSNNYYLYLLMAECYRLNGNDDQKEACLELVNKFKGE